MLIVPENWNLKFAGLVSAVLVSHFSCSLFVLNKSFTPEVDLSWQRWLFIFFILNSLEAFSCCAVHPSWVRAYQVFRKPGSCLRDGRYFWTGVAWSNIIHTMIGLRPNKRIENKMLSSEENNEEKDIIYQRPHAHRPFRFKLVLWVHVTLVRSALCSQ